MMKNNILKQYYLDTEKYYLDSEKIENEGSNL